MAREDEEAERRGLKMRARREDMNGFLSFGLGRLGKVGRWY